jgi:hypothetical protein
MAKAHLVIIKGPDGSPTTYPLKKWLRENPDNLPSEMHPNDNTSHELRRGLKRMGWSLQFTSNEVLLISVKRDEKGYFEHETHPFG